MMRFPTFSIVDGPIVRVWACDVCAKSQNWALTFASAAFVAASTAHTHTHTQLFPPPLPPSMLSAAAFVCNGDKQSCRHEVHRNE